MKKRLIRALITSVVMSSLFVATVLATPEEDVADLKNQTKAAEEDVASLESQKQAAQSQASSVNRSLTDLLTEYQALENDIANQNVKIEEAEKDLAAAEEEEETQYQDMKLRIKYMYEEGDTSFIAALFSAESFSDLISKSEYVDKVYNYDRQKLKEYIETKEQVQELKDELEGEEAEMEDMAVEMESQTNTLQATLSSLESQISDFDTQLAQAQKEAEEALAAQKAAEEALEKAEEEAAAKAAEEEAAAKAAEEEAAKAAEKERQKAAQAEEKASTEKKQESTTEKKSESSSSGKKTSSSDSGSSTSATPGNASLGQAIADKACEYIGGKYVYGGNNLATGVDCSGFVQQIHKMFGISTPRSSYDVRFGGKAVSWADKLPGDVICYSGHVAIYIGNNTIVHASNSAPYPKGGIKTTTPANYKTVLAVRRYW